MNARVAKMLELDYPDLSDRAVLLLLIVAAFASLLVSGLMNLLGFGWLDGALQNFGTEMIGAFVTFILFEKIIGARDRRAVEQQQLKREVRDLIRRTRSSANDIAKDAVDELRERELLIGKRGVLAGQRLREANLVEARLVEANLRKVNLYKADLHRADLTRADLQGADLTGATMYNTRLNKANLQDAQLSDANLHSASLGSTDLRNANLQGADLHMAEIWGAKLEGATLRGANLNSANLNGAHMTDSDMSRADLRAAKLDGANFAGVDLQQTLLRGASGLDTAIFNEETLLPDARIVAVDEDGTPQHDQYWTPDVDMMRYCDPNHPAFWQPIWAQADYESYRAWSKAGKPAPESIDSDVDNAYTGRLDQPDDA